MTNSSLLTDLGEIPAQADFFDSDTACEPGGVVLRGFLRCGPFVNEPRLDFAFLMLRLSPQPVPGKVPGVWCLPVSLSTLESALSDDDLCFYGQARVESMRPLTFFLTDTEAKEAYEYERNLYHANTIQEKLAAARCYRDWLTFVGRADPFIDNLASPGPPGAFEIEDFP